MNKSNEQRLFEAAIMWNRPLLKASSNPGAEYLVEVFDLGPRLFDEKRNSSDMRNDPLGLAAQGLTHELTGDRDRARVLYSELAGAGGTGGLVGKLLLAWMSDATVEASYTVEDALEDERPAIQARVRIKLMTWAKSRGWVEFAEGQYGKALAVARGELKAALQFQGHWFGRRQMIRMTSLSGDLVLYPWIIDAADRSAGAALDDYTKRLGQGSNTRVMRIGPPEGREIQSAELQADWAGAHWLLPQIWRRHASVLFSRTLERDDVPRAISLWIRGSGSNITGLIERYEADLSDLGAKELLVDGLKEGGATKDDRDWIKACLALWDQMPDTLVVSLIRGMKMSDSWVSWSQQPTVTEPLALFAVLAAREPAHWRGRFEELSMALRSLVIRCMSVGVAAGLETADKSRALDAVLSQLENADIDESWRDAGWSTVARLARDVGSAHEQARVAQALPARAVAALAVEYPDLVPEPRARSELEALSQQVTNELAQMSQGAYGFGGQDSCIAAMQCMIRLGSVVGEVLELIVQVASDPSAAPFQASGALRALRSGVGAGIVSASQVGPAILNSRAPEGLRFWDYEAEIRVERAERAALEFVLNNRSLEGVVAATKDPDVRVRCLGLGALLDAAVSADFRSPILDACLMGGLYDPEPAVQALAARGVVRQFVSEDTISDICWARMVEVWHEAHRSVRTAIASELPASSGPLEAVEELLRLARRDRSATVRLALSFGRLSA